MKHYQRINNLLGWITFGISFLVYFLTLEPTTSWWDCGEYITTAFKLQVGHPPGAPTFQMIGRLFSLAAGDVTQVAYTINIMSAVSSAFTILFLFWSITLLARKLVAVSGEMTEGKMVTVMGAGLIGALAYTFSDSFWFSAAEGEVYAMSSFFTAIVFWAILKWESVADEEHSLRWLILIAFLVGLSIGVHLLNLLAIPAITYIYYYKKYQPTWKGLTLAGVISLLILALIMYGIIPDIVNLFSKTELLFVNKFGLPFNSGTAFFALLILAVIITGLLYTHHGDRHLKPFAITGIAFLLLVLNGSDGTGSFIIRLLLSAAAVYAVLKLKKHRHIINAVLLSFAFILIGYSAFMMLVIRANTNTPINENDPRDAISLLSYLNREQYGTWPLLYGHYYNAPVVDYADQSPLYRHDDKTGKYIIADERKGTVSVYDKRFMTLFPRMWSNQKSSHTRTYETWGKITGVPIQVTQRDGKSETIMKPTFTENLRFFFTYQVGHMYFRYFMWNFAGRQNDVEGHGGIEDGNWISGIRFIDEARIGNLDKYPEHRKNPANNKFYFLPLIIGLLGFFYHLKKHARDTFVVGLLFFMTGLAIVIYLNQTPFQPRERDYAYAGSFYAFAIWIGLGVMAIADWLQKYMKPVMAGLLATIVSLSVPGILASEGWDDHNRAHKTAALDFAHSYLDSTQPQSILFTFGDNDTFPIWYAQEVENHRTDVRVVNFMLASGDWYIQQMARKVYDSEPISFTIPVVQYLKGSNDILPVIELNSKGDPILLSDILRFVADERNKRDFGDGQKLTFFPTKRIRIPVDTAAMKASGIIPDEFKDKILPYLDFTIRKNYIYKNDLMLLDILATNNWQRPIYFTSPSGIGSIINVDTYCHLEGMVYKFLPVNTVDYIRGLGGVSPDTCYDILVNRITRWGNLNDPRVVVDRESFRNAQIPRQNYMRVAQAMLNKNMKAEAIRALDLALVYFPTNKIAADKYLLSFTEIYYAAGATEKANKLSLELAKIFADDLTYYYSLQPKFSQQFENEKTENAMLLKRLAQLAAMYEQDETAGAIEALLGLQIQ